MRATAALGPITAIDFTFAGVQRQQPALVLEEHNAFRRSLERDGALLRCVYFAAARMRMVEQAAEENDAEDAAHVVIEPGLLDIARLDLGQHLIALQPGAAVAAHDGSRA